MFVSGAAVAGPVLVTLRSALGNMTVVLVVEELLAEFGSTSSALLLTEAVLLSTAPSARPEPMWVVTVRPTLDPLDMDDVLQEMVLPRPHAVGGGLPKKFASTKVSPGGSGSLMLTLLAVAGPLLA